MPDYFDQPEFAVEVGYLIPNYEQRGVSKGLSVPGPYVVASEYESSAERDFKEYGRLNMADVIEGGKYRFGNGTVTAPAVGWSGDTNSGRFWIAEDTYGESTGGVERQRWGASESVINEDGADYDFRVESDTNTQALLVDAAGEFVKVGGRLRVGTATDDATQGDFVTGLTGAARLFYDQSVPALYFYGSAGTIVNQISAVAGTGTVFNELGSDQDFRVEGDTNANLFFVDASTDRVGIQTSTPRSSFDVSGTGGTDWTGELRIGPTEFGGSVGLIFGTSRRLNTGYFLIGRNLSGIAGSDSFQTTYTQSVNVGYCGIEFTYGASAGIQIFGDTGNTIAGTVVVPRELARFQISGIFLNSAVGDIDTLIRGDVASSLFLCDAGLDAVLIGTTAIGVIADFRGTGIVFNEEGANRDFRVEGDTDTSLFFIDASLDAVMVGTGTQVTGALLTVDGRLSTVSTATYPALLVGSVAGDPSTLVNGDIWYNSTTGKFRAREAGASVDLVNSADILKSYKDADESVTNSAALQDDDELTVSVIASTKYRFRAYLFVTSVSATAGFKFGLGGTATVTSMKAQLTLFDDTTDAMAALARVTALGSSTGAGLGAGDNFATIEGTIEVNAAGTLLVRWAQNLADAVNATIVQRGSYIELVKLP